MNNATSAFTLKANGMLNALKTEVMIDSKVRNLSKNVDKDRKWRGLWDTGASKSSIDKRVAKELGLISVGRSSVSTANGVMPVETYFVDLTLPNHVTVRYVLVSGADLGDDIDLLIGMDIIGLGDFSITNTNRATTFSFRIPSVSEIDYVDKTSSNT